VVHSVQHNDKLSGYQLFSNRVFREGKNQMP
jgi:hypothetical protein